MSKVYINLHINGLVDAAALGAFLSNVESEHSIAESAAPTSASKPAPKTETKKVEEPKEEKPAGKKVEETAPPAADVPTKEEVTAAAQALVGANGREALAELLEQFGAKNLSTIPDDKKAEFIGKCEEKTQ